MSGLTKRTNGQRGGVRSLAVAVGEEEEAARPGRGGGAQNEPNGQRGKRGLAVAVGRRRQHGLAVAAVCKTNPTGRGQRSADWARRSGQNEPNGPVTGFPPRGQQGNWCDLNHLAAFGSII